MENLKAKTVIISKPNQTNENYEKFKQIVKKRRIKVLIAKKKDILKIEKNLYFDILWPKVENQNLENELNNNSLVCKLNYKNFTMLFTGDIEHEAERKILNEYKNNTKKLNSTVLKVAHHGSNTSSTKEFINLVKPKIALIGVGKNNKFGHPNDEVIDRLVNTRDKNL